MRIRSIITNLLLITGLSVGWAFPQAVLARAAPTSPNALPVAVNDSYTTPENTLLSIVAPGVLLNDISSDPTTLGANLVKTTSRGALSLHPDGSFTYNPVANFSGTDVFTYTATDSNGTSNPARVTLTITPINHPPLPVDDQVSTHEDTAVIIDVLANDTDPDGNLDPTSVTIVSGPTNGTTSVDHLTGKVTYTPGLYFHGVDTFIYQVCDTLLACARANVTVDVIFVNHPPVAQDDYATTAENSPVTINVTANDTDVDGNLDPRSVTIFRPAMNGSTSVDPLTGSVTYLGHPYYNGNDNFGYQVCDTSQACSTANVYITVTPVNYPPVAHDDTASTNENTSVRVDVLANDTDPDGFSDLVPSSVTVIGQPFNGRTQVDPSTGAITFTPDPNYSGTGAFRYQVCDHQPLCSQANVTIAIAWVNQPPVAIPDSASTNEETSVLINVAANDTDPDGNLDLTSVAVVRPPSNGSAVLSPTPGTVLYTPNLNFYGTDSFVYQICDRGVPPLCSSAVVTVTVIFVNDPPVAAADTYFINQDTLLSPVAPGVLANDSDVDSPIIYSALENTTTHGKLTLNSNGSFTYVPQAGFAGRDFFRYHAYDESLLVSNSVPVTITVYDTQAPVINLWLQPKLANKGIYYVKDRFITLEVSASDNVAIDHVRFSRWDPGLLKHVDIASIPTAPYIWQLDTRTLQPGFNQVYARAYDTSGNDSGQDNFIWLYVSRNVFLPAILR